MTYFAFLSCVLHTFRQLVWLDEELLVLLSVVLANLKLNLKSVLFSHALTAATPSHCLLGGIASASHRAWR